MGTYSSLINALGVSLFFVSLIFFPSFAQSQVSDVAETQMDQMDFVSLEDELLATSTDDAQAQQREAEKAAQLARQEEAEALERLKKAKAHRGKVISSSRQKMAEDMRRQRIAINKRDRYNSRAIALEREIASIEAKIEKINQETQKLIEEEKVAREHFEQLRKQRGELRRQQLKANSEKNRAKRSLQKAKVVQR